jgi:WD40 repeat protein
MKIPGRLTRLTVGHLLFGVLLICLDPILSALIGEQNAFFFSLEAFSPLIPCIGLVWVLVGASLQSGSPLAIDIARRSHLFAVIGWGALAVLGVVLLVATSLGSDGSHGHSVGAALFPVLVVLVLIYVAVLGISSGIAALSLRRLLREENHGGNVWSAVSIGLAGIALFFSTLASRVVHDQHRRERAEVAQAEFLTTVAHDRGAVKYLAFSPDGQSLATATEDCVSVESVQLWDVDAGSLVDTIEAGKLVCSLNFGCKPDQLIVGLDNKNGNLGGPHLWGIKNHTRLFDGGLASVAGIAVSPDCKYLVGCAHRGTWENARPASFVVWDVDTGEQMYESEPHPGYVSAAFSVDGKALAVRRPKVIEVWDFPITPGDAPTELLDVGSFDDDVAQLSFSSDGAELAVSAAWGVKLWDISTGMSRELEVLDRFTQVQALAFSDDRSIIVIAKQSRIAQGSRVCVIDWATESVKYTVDAPFQVAGLAVSPDDKIIAVGGWQRVQLFDAESGEFLRELNRSP